MKHHLIDRNRFGLIDPKNFHLHTIAFYNVENLFDPHSHPKKFDDDYTPEGKHRWSKILLDQKINQLAKVILKIGKSETKRPPLIVGLVEIENQSVLKLLVNHPLLKPYQYRIIHYESPDFRGIDVALLYQKNFFNYTNAKTYSLELVNSGSQAPRTTRDQLVVSGFLGKEKIHLIVNHWPSRRGGVKKVLLVDGKQLYYTKE